MGEFASKGVAGTGLGLGIAGTALGVLAGNNGGNGLLGGILGGGWNRQAAEMGNAAVANKIMEQEAEISRLKAEKYSDHSGIELYKALKADINGVAEKSFNDLTTVRQNILGEWGKPLAQESASNRERLVALEKTVEGNKALTDKDMELLRKDVEISKLETKVGMERLDNKIDMVASHATCGINANSAAIAGLKAVVDGITCTKVCKDSICPEVMPRWNAWEAPTDNAPATQPVTGSVNVR